MDRGKIINKVENYNKNNKITTHKTFGLTLSKQTCKDKEADALFEEEEA